MKSDKVGLKSVLMQCKAQKGSVELKQLKTTISNLPVSNDSNESFSEPGQQCAVGEVELSAHPKEEDIQNSVWDDSPESSDNDSTSSQNLLSAQGEEHSVNGDDHLTAQDMANMFHDSSSETTKKPLTIASLQQFSSKVDRTGVVYLSRIPPFMRPSKLRQLLSTYAPLGRIYLVPEDPKIAARRRKYRHNKRPNFVEGWVEFLDKKQARSIAEHLNNSNIGGKKRSYYHDDIWNMKYLPKFKWHHLTEQIAYELKVREQKVAAEMAQAKRETMAFMANVAKAKMIEGMQERRNGKRKEHEDNVGSGDALTLKAQFAPKADRKYKQRKIVDSDACASGRPKTNDFAGKKSVTVLGKLFA